MIGIDSKERMCYCLRIVLLSLSLTSPSGAGILNDSASRSTRGINDSIVLRHAIVCYENREYHERYDLER